MTPDNTRELIAEALYEHWRKPMVAKADKYGDPHPPKWDQLGTFQEDYLAQAEVALAALDAVTVVPDAPTDAHAEAERRYIPRDRPTMLPDHCAVMGFVEGAEWAAARVAPKGGAR